MGTAAASSAFSERQAHESAAKKVGTTGRVEKPASTATERAAQGRGNLAVSCSADGTTPLEGDAVVADLVEPEFATELPVFPGIRGKRGPKQILALQQFSLVHPCLGQLFLRLGRLEADDLRLIGKASEVGSGFLDSIPHQPPSHLGERGAIFSQGRQ